MTTKDQAIAPNKQLLEKFDELLPAPDCRTCENNCACKCHGRGNECTNGDEYQPAPKVVLWRTEP